MECCYDVGDTNAEDTRGEQQLGNRLQSEINNYDREIYDNL